jgi:putative ABC transport system permease protein
MSRLRTVGPVAWANLRGHRIPAALIALTLAASGGLLTFGLAAQAASPNAFDRLWRATNGADLWLYLDAGRVTPASIDDIMAHTPGVASWGQPQRQASVTPLVAQNSWGYGFVLRDWPTDTGALGHPELVAGRQPQRGDGDVVVLDINVARTWRLGIDSTLGIPTPSGVHQLRVVGLDANAENCPYPLCGPQSLFLPPGQLATLGLIRGGSVGQLAVGVRIQRATAARVSAVRDAIAAHLPVGSVAWAAPAATTRQFAALGYGTQSGLLLAFALVAAAASILLIVVAIGGAVRSDSRRIGLLKAVGFSTGQLRLTMLAEYVGLAVVGSASGAAVAAVWAPHILAPVVSQFGAGSPGLPWRGAVVAVAAITILATGVVLMASRRSVRLDAVSALRSDATGAHGAEPLLPGPLFVSRAVGEITASRARSALTATALALAAGALVMAALFQSGLGLFMDRLAFDGARTGDLVVRTSDQFPSGRAASVFASQDGVIGVVRERSLNFTLPGSADIHVLRLRSGDLTTIPQSLVSGRQLEGPGEIVVGYGLARLHHLSLGQTLDIGVAGTAHALRIVGVNREINNLGQMATTLAASVEGAVPFDQPQYLVRLRPGTDGADVASRIEAASGGLMEPTVISPRILPPLLRSIRPVIGALAAVLALLTALGVFNAVLLGVQERRHEYGLVRAVGMSRGQVLGIALTATAMVATAACLVAIPLATIGGSALLNAVQGRLGIGPLSAPVPATVLAVGPAVVLVALVGALGPAWSASRTNIAAVLREL